MLVSFFIMKKALLLIATLAVLAGASAKPVDPVSLSRIVSSFFPGREVRGIEIVDGIYLSTPVDGRGFLLHSADNCVRPVLAFSPNGRFDAGNMPAHVRGWIDGYAREIAAMREAGAVPSARVEAEWTYYLEGAPKTVGDSVAPMLTTIWNQAPYFNLLCPYDTDDSAYCVTGCTATATAQIMKYWNHPATGMGSHSYYHPSYGMLSANFGNTNYRWADMPDTVNYLTDSSSMMAVAELMYHVGVSVNMNYSPHSSGAYVNSYGSSTRASSENALKTYFKYNPMLMGVFKAEYTDYEWDSIMRFEVDAGRPVLYSGYDSAGGHAFVFDGYKEMADSNTDASNLFFHINWGWGGAYDGYYTVDSLSPGAGGIGGNATYTFNMGNSAVIGIQPLVAASDSIVVIDMVSSNPQHGTVIGSGTYTPLVDNVQIRAVAAEGYRFVRWKSGSMQNPISFVACGDMTDTAIFEPLCGDTLGYCFDGLMSSWADDYGATTEWGIRIPASMRGVGRGMRAVQFYPYVDGDHTLNIYIGDSITPATLAYSMVISVPSYAVDDWNSYALDSLLPIPEHSVVWVTMKYQGTGVYPASVSRYSGNGDGCWYHLPNGWAKFDDEDIFYCTWMLRAVFEPRQFTVTVYPNDPNVCSTYGDGTYFGGDQVTIGAVILDQHCTFLRWTDGSPYNPYTFTITTDTVMVAYCSCDVGIDDVEDDELQISVDGLTIDINQEAEFYDLQGRLLAVGRRAVMPAAGVYVLRVGGTARKVVVF